MMWGGHLRTYIESLTRLSDVEKAEEVSFIEKTLEGQGAADGDKMEALIFRGLRLQAFRLIEGLVNDE